jgi:NAD(P)-dependent dehydrogenase (short-subunit alcohol dehydrogenase family)
LLCREQQQILITGATNGIGLAAAEALAARGANLAIVGRSKTRTRIASARIRAAAGRRARRPASSPRHPRRIGEHTSRSTISIAERSYWGFGRYCETKLANILFTIQLARRLDGTGVTANCFHPGLVATGFNRNNGLLMDLGEERDHRR